MRKFLSIYKTCIGTAFAAAFTYRLNFVLMSLLALGHNALFPLVTVLIYNNGASFPGWNFYEVLLIQAVFLLSSSMAYLIFDGVLWSTMQHVREGTFEVVLLKPLSPLAYLIVTAFNPEIMAGVIAGGVLLGVSLYFTGIPAVSAIPQFLFLFTAGFCVMAGINMIMAAVSFKWVGNSRIPDIFDSITTFGKYPGTIFPQVVRGISTFIIPVGMVGFFPASALLGRAETSAYFAAIPCFMFMLFGIWLYRHMVKLYEGVGG